MSEEAAPAELFAPRGLEAYVRALADLRRRCWAQLPEDVRTLLEVGDYVGLTAAIGDPDARLVELLPGPLWARYESLFWRQRGHGYSPESLVGAIALALRRSRLSQLNGA
jgi:hypothetical protein